MTTRTIREVPIDRAGRRRIAPRRVLRKKTRNTTTKPKKAKKPSITKQKKEADRVMSLAVRQSSADKDGMVKCYTCPYVGHWKKLQNGHLVSRFYLATRYDLRNCRPQCITCNIWRHGRTPEFAQHLKEELGDGIVEELFAKARAVVLHFDYEEVIAEFTRRLEKLQSLYEKSLKP